METKLYIEGYQSENGQIVCPLPTSVILFIIQYCQHNNLSIIFISDENSEALDSCTFKDEKLSDLNISFTTWADVPEIVKNVSLPSLHQPDLKLVRSGLCVALRHIISEAHEKCPSFKLIELLGFRCGSMKMCAEVSSWTKLCEVDLPHSVAQLISTLRDHESTPHSDETYFSLPSDLLKLESHFLKKCLVHNDDKKQRADLLRLKGYEWSSVQLSNGEKPSENNVNACGDYNSVKLDTLSVNAHELHIEQTVGLNHGVRKFRVRKRTDQNVQAQQKDGRCCKSSEYHQSPIKEESKCTSETAFDLSELQVVLDSLVHTDIEYLHVYSEGIEMTMADLIIFTYVYFLLERIDFDCYWLSRQLPNVMKWASHMTSISQVLQASLALGFRMEDLKKGLTACSSGEESREHNQKDTKEMKGKFLFRSEEMNENEEDVELSRNIRMKHKAIKHEVIQVLKKFETQGIIPLEGSHPKGDDILVDWASLPDGIHPKQGDVPMKRAVRKCQQLENLATAIQAIALPGNSIVDFCSGGGHLGIVLAYLLPECQILLVENKEESLLKSCSRLKSLELTNVTLYQCNMDYFTGKFDIGTCLHACGSATDMVLQLCLQSDASFIICPCCYGSIHNTHLLSYPRSKHFTESKVTYKDFLTLGHAADQTEFNIALEGQGRMCMSLIDTDRAHYAKELNYTVSLCSLKPLSCTPKNSLLIGSPMIKKKDIKDQ